MTIKKTYKKCRMCKKAVRGRSDKIFCSTTCKSIYHSKLKEANQSVTSAVDKILHRNRIILLEILGKKETMKKVIKLDLDKKNFNYSYYTSTHVNKQEKRVYNIYDFSYLIFSDQEVLITRNHRFSA